MIKWLLDTLQWISDNLQLVLTGLILIISLIGVCLTIGFRIIDKINQHKLIAKGRLSTSGKLINFVVEVTNIGTKSIHIKHVILYGENNNYSRYIGLVGQVKPGQNKGVLQDVKIEDVGFLKAVITAGNGRVWTTKKLSKKHIESIKRRHQDNLLKFEESRKKLNSPRKF